MGLFRRRNELEVEPERCPICTERVPEGAQECGMCGADLRSLGLGSPESDTDERRSAA
jgi:hypothetical protein